jgi:hypothetical protein
MMVMMILRVLVVALTVLLAVLLDHFILVQSFWVEASKSVLMIIPGRHELVVDTSPIIIV